MTVTTSVTRSLGWRATPPTVSDPARPRPRHEARLWMWSHLAAYPTPELREILRALEATSGRSSTDPDDLGRNDLIQAIGEIDAEMDRQRRRGRADA